VAPSLTSKMEVFSSNSHPSQNIRNTQKNPLIKLTSTLYQWNCNSHNKNTIKVTIL